MEAKSWLACHEAASKPFLRPRIPAEPQVRLISFTPGARLPEQG